MNILLIYPKYPETFWSFKHVLKFVHRKATFPPLGLMTVAAMLPKEWNKRLIDVNITELKDKDITWADMVFISAMIVQKKSAKEIISKCKENGKRVVAGGPLFTIQYKEFQGVDHFVLGEAEVTLPFFLKDLKNNKPKYVYTSSIRPDITKTPIPIWNLINFKDYVTMPVQYSRGCPFNCEFCDIIVMNGRKPRTKTPEQLVSEIQSLYEAGWKGGIFIVDDNFIGNKVNVKKMLPELIKWQKQHKYPYQIITEASINLADDTELMEMMSVANFSKVFLGIETPCVESLKESGKTQNISRDLAQSVRIIQGYGMQVMGGFIIGFDKDTESIFETQIKFIQKIGVVQAMVGLLTAIPKTRLWHRLKAEGRIIKNPSGENTQKGLNFIPKMGKEKLVSGYKKVIKTLYSPKNYYKRINTFIKNYKPTVRVKISFSDFCAFLKSTVKIGVFSKSRILYWKLLIKTFLTKRKALPIAIELAIIGLHFEKFMQYIINL